MDSVSSTLRLSYNTSPMNYTTKYNKRYSPREKAEMVLHLISGAYTLKRLQQETGIAKDTLIDWKKKFFNNIEALFIDQKSKQQLKDAKDKLIERQHKQIDLLKKLLEHYKQIPNKVSSPYADSS